MFNPFEPGYVENPYPQWAALRHESPVAETPLGFYVVSKHADVLHLVRDPGMSVEQGNAVAGPMQAMFEELAGDLDLLEDQAGSMLGRDDPDHARLRKLVTKAFTPRVIDQLRPRIQQLVDEALDKAEAAGTIEVIAELAFPLPFAVITEMLGMPETDTAQLREWSGLIVKSLEPVVDPVTMKAIADAAANMEALVRGVIADTRANPGDGLLTAMIQAEENGDFLNDEELTAQVALLYIAGHETTVNLIGNGALALARHPDQLQRLVEDPSLVPNAVEEFLRYDPPVQFTRRITLRDVEVQGQSIPAGRFVVCSIASANRDEDAFGPDADRLDVSRANAREHLAFGGGIHYCLGAALARLEGQVALGTLVRRFPGLRLAGEPVWNGRVNLRGLDQLQLDLG